MNLNFTEWEIRANNFFTAVYGPDLDFSSVPPLGIDAYGAPYKENNASYLFLLTYNDGHFPDGTYRFNPLELNTGNYSWSNWMTRKK